MTAALTFTSTARDPVTGTPRTVTLTVAGAALFVGIAPANASRRVDPHTSTADFTPQLESIATAIHHAAEERAKPMCGCRLREHEPGCPYASDFDHDTEGDDDE